MSKAVQLTLIMLAVVFVCSTVSGYTTRPPNRKKHKETITVQSSTYQSLNAPTEQSTANYQLLSVSKSVVPAYNIFMSVKNQSKRTGSVADYRNYVNEEKTQDQRFEPEMTSGSAGFNKFISKTAEVGMNNVHYKVGEDRKRCSAMFDKAHRNIHLISKSHGHTFRCCHCLCSYISEKVISANCAQQNLTTVPMKLPNNTRTLNISLNNIQSLGKTSFLQYPNLTVLDFTGCVINRIHDGSFAVLSKLINLTLKNNRLAYLSKNTFTGLECLQTLDLSNNNVSKIEMGAFDNLRHLKNLALSGNKCLGYSNETFSSRLLMKLKHLEMLCIFDNTNGTENSYPNKALQPLEALQYLSIDGLAGSTEFGPEMKDLVRLVHLEIRGTCKITNISATFFENVPRLKFLLIQGCDINSIHPEAYAFIRHLRSLILANLPGFIIGGAFEALASLNNSGLKSLTFTNLSICQYINPCTYLDKEHAKYITNINLDELDLSYNNIVVLKADFFKGLPRNLKRLFLIGNKFAFESGVHIWAVYAVLKEVVFFDLSMQNTNEFYHNHNVKVADYSSLLQYADKKYLERHEEKIISHMERDNCVPMESYLDNNKATCYDDLALYRHPWGTDRACERLYKRMYLDFPPNLQTLKASQYQGFGMSVLAHVLPENNSLRSIDFTNSFLPEWGSGVLPRTIVTAKLGNNYCKRICKGFFQPNNSHEHLNLRNNILGVQFAQDEGGSIFAELTKTVRLDISRNRIFHLPKQFFKGLINLKTLKLSRNRLPRLDVSLKHMRNLQYIDLCKNAIRWISQETRDDIDAIATDHTLGIDLSLNPLPCTCAGLDIITWMATTKVHFHKSHLLTCDSDDSTFELIGNLEERRTTLKRLCMSKTVLIIGSVAALSVMMISVGLGLVYRYRWKLRYLHNIALAAVFGFQPDVLPNSGCTFDAYLVYTKETQDFVINTCIKELELKRGHRLCIEDRDFLVGTYIVSNIVSAVRNSTKTIPVMTPTFYNGVFSEYSFKMAIMEELYNNRCVLHLLLYKPIPTEQMTHDELKVMERNSYIEFPPEEEADDNIRQQFWDDLSVAIGHTDNPTPQELPGMQ